MRSAAAFRLAFAPPWLVSGVACAFLVGLASGCHVGDSEQWALQAPAPAEAGAARGAAAAPEPLPVPIAPEAGMPSAAGDAPGAATEPGADAARQATLEDLLRLPASAGQYDAVAERLKRRPSDDPGEGSPSRGLAFEVEKREEHSVRSTSRSRTDAAVAADIGKDTKLRGGVRVERETGRALEDPAPTVGIEKRF